MTNLWVIFNFWVFLVVEQTALSSQRKRIPWYSAHHTRSSDPMYKYQPHLDPEGCEQPPTSLSTTIAFTPIVSLEFPTENVHKSQRPDVQKLLLHKHLLLVTGQVHQEYIGQCSMAVQAQDLSDLDAKLRMSTAVVRELPLNDIVVVQVGTGWRPDIRIIDVVAEHLGNVSLYTDIRYLNKIMNKHCEDIGVQRCSLLTSLTPVLEQLEPANVWPGVYDPNWIPMPPLPPMSNALYAQSTEKQIEYLTWRLCVRDRRHNLYYKLDKDSPLTALSEPKDVAETENPVFETSLSLNDILPVNPKNYDKNRAPKVQGQPTIVYFHVTVLSLDSINEESMTYVADIFLAQSWRDPRLRMPENMSEEYRILDVDWLHQIWRPDCFFKNAKKVTFHEMSIPNHYLWLYHDKTLLYMSKLTLVLSCAMKFESYPHDTQICTMMIESLSHTTHDLVFIWNMTDPLVVNPEIELPQLDISNNVTSDCTIQYSTGNFTCLAVVFNLRRRLGYHLFHTYIPSALIVVMSWISFWIKPEAIPARVTLGVTSLLTLATQNTQSQQSLPPVSYVKAIDIWMSSCSIFVFLSLMEFAVVNNYMGPVATKVMKGYSEDDVRGGDELNELDPKSRNATKNISAIAATPQYPTFCNGRAIALYIDKFSSWKRMQHKYFNVDLSHRERSMVRRVAIAKDRIKHM